jgi:hypothetical protein
LAIAIMPPNFSSTANEIWAVADLLRGDFKQSQYGRIILPFALLRRLECVLAPTKAAVLAKVPAVAAMPVEAQEKLLLREAKHFFYNTSPMDLGKLGETDTARNLETYIQSFSPDAREIFEHFKFADFVHLLDDANLLYLVIQRFAAWDLSPKAGQHDNKRAREVCATILSGEIVVFDKAYVDFDHLFDLNMRGVWWVTRAKDNMKFRVVKNHTKGHENIIKDQVIALQGKHKGMQLRRVEAWVEVDDAWRVMVFITNNLEWSPRSVCDLYRRRWDIEVFFKQVKQSLKLGSFLGHSANAVRWQVYTALLIYVLLRFMAHLSAWGHSFTRLFAVTRSALWERIDLLALLKSYGTASGRFKVIGALNTAWLPGFTPIRT